MKSIVWIAGNVVFLAFISLALADGSKGGMTWNAQNSFDASLASMTKPHKTGTAVPATCAVGESFFDTDASAGQNVWGRVPIGVPSGGTLAGTVGTALTDLQDPTHSHGVGTLVNSVPTFTGNALSGGTRKGGTSNPASIIENNAAVTGSVSAPTISGSTAAVSATMPYIQYRWCSKD